MGITEIILLALGLSMDAFAVSVCQGISSKKSGIKNSLICGIWFGVFQALMPVIGYLLSANFERYISAIAPWIAFLLLLLIGLNMLKESAEDEQECCCESRDNSFKTMFLMAVATSIDALAVGVTFTCVPMELLSTSRLNNVLLGAGIIGVVTFVISTFGVKIGSDFGMRWKKKAEIAGGVILIFIGIKILCEHLFF